MMKGFARLMLARVEGWVIALLAVVGLVGAIGFGAVVKATALGSNDVMIHDFTTGKVTSPWRGALRALDVRSVSEGRSEVLADGGVFIEETNSGRILRLDRDGAVRWSYVNRAGDGALYRLNWSRILPRAKGDAIREAVARAGCGHDA